MRSVKVGAMLQAQLRIARELRQWLRLLATDAVRVALHIPLDPASKGGFHGHSKQDSEDLGLADLVEPLLQRSEGVIEDAVEFQRRIDSGEIDADDLDADLGPGFGSPLPAPG